MIFSNLNSTIELNDQNGEILSLKCSNKEFVGQVLPLFCFRLRKCGETFEFSSNQANSVHSSQTKNSASFTFSGFCDYDITFVSKLTKKDEAFYWDLSYKNNTGLCVEWVSYPRISVPNDLAKVGGSGKILVDNNEGLIVEDMNDKQESHQFYRPCEYPSEGMYAMFPGIVQSQFLSYYDNTAGLYFAAHDSKRSVKGINFYTAEQNAIKLEFKLYPGVDANITNYSFDFQMVMQCFMGDWHAPAQIYREWFEKNLPDGLKKICDSTDFPEWYSDTPLIVAYPVSGVHDMDTPTPNKLFPYNNALNALEDISEKTNSRIMALLMHWEGTAPWAPPYVCPPLGGYDELRSFAKNLHDKNNLLGVYCSGISYTVKSNLNDYNCEKEIEENNLLQYMCAPPDGAKPVSNTCQAQRVSYDMCPSCDFTKDVMVGEAEKMASCDLDYIQILDQNHGGTPYFCYSDKHTHAPVPGLWQVQHMNELLSRVKETVGHNILLGCESAAAESFMGNLKLSDNRFNLNYACGYPVPLYGYIYHEYLHNFSGNSVCSQFFIDTNRTPEGYLMRTAHSFIAGDLMTLVINQDGDIASYWGQKDFSDIPDRDGVLKFIKSATTLRRGVAKDFLVYGKMIAPCKTVCREIPIYRPDDQKAMHNYPVIMTSAWQSQKNTKAQIFANYTPGNEMCVVDLTNTKGARLLSYKGETLKNFGSSEVSFAVPCHSVVMLEFE